MCRLPTVSRFAAITFGMKSLQATPPPQPPEGKIAPKRALSVSNASLIGPRMSTGSPAGATASPRQTRLSLPGSRPSIAVTTSPRQQSGRKLTIVGPNVPRSPRKSPVASRNSNSQQQDGDATSLPILPSSTSLASNASFYSVNSTIFEEEAPAPMVSERSPVHVKREADADRAQAAVRVVVRTRPLHPHETADGIASIVNVAPDDATLHVTSEGQGGRVITKSFVFPKSLRPTDTQSDVFHNSGVKDLLDSALDGYAATVFAYGQTGSGKTYTMTGGDVQRSGGQDEATDGLIPRAAQYIFDALAGDFASSNAQEPDTVMSTAVPFESPSSPKASARGKVTPKLPTSPKAPKQPNNSNSNNTPRKKTLTTFPSSSSRSGSVSSPIPTRPISTSRKPGPNRRVSQHNSTKTPHQQAKPKTKVLCTFCEVYNEQVYDLLNLSEETLPVRWDAKHKTFNVPDLLTVECTSVEEFMMVVREGLKNRTIGSTALNKDSSRSHSLLTVYIERALVDDTDGFVLMKHGKVVFVDLAGSEREAHSGVQGEAAKETRNINLSLLSLGKVISVLASVKQAANSRPRTSQLNVPAKPQPEPAGRRKLFSNGGNATPLLSNQGPAPNHIPYRDSKLTKLLMDSLGGSALTLMIACVSPLPKHLDDTLNTLNYATRASNIKNKPALQMDETELLIMNLRKEVTFLRQENAFLVTRLEGSAKTESNPMLTALRACASSETVATAVSDDVALPVLCSGRKSDPPALSGSDSEAHKTEERPKARKLSLERLMIGSEAQTALSQNTIAMIKSFQMEIARLRAEACSAKEEREIEAAEYKTISTENDELRRKLDAAEKMVLELQVKLNSVDKPRKTSDQSLPSKNEFVTASPLIDEASDASTSIPATASLSLSLTSRNHARFSTFQGPTLNTTLDGERISNSLDVDVTRLHSPIAAALAGRSHRNLSASLASSAAEDPLFADWDGNVDRLKQALLFSLRFMTDLQSRRTSSMSNGATLNTKTFSEFLHASREQFTVRAASVVNRSRIGPASASPHGVPVAFFPDPPSLSSDIPREVEKLIARGAAPGVRTLRTRSPIRLADSEPAESLPTCSDDGYSDDEFNSV